MEYVNISLVVVFAVAFHEYDSIIFQKKYSLFYHILKGKAFDWYFTNNWQTESWWLKNVFVFFLDGLHLISSIWRTIAFFFFSQLVFDDWEVYALTVALYVVTGAIHSILNSTLFNFKQKEK